MEIQYRNDVGLYVMNHQPLVSVITATYNMANFIDVAINSVLNQTYKNIQYIIIDDGSTDNTAEIANKYRNDPRLEYHYQKNQGQTIAKNNGIVLSKGEYICFLDADNMWKLDKLEKQISVFSKLPPKYKIVYTHQLYIDGNGNSIQTPNIKRYSGKISDKLLFENFVTFNTAMIKRECFEDLGTFDEKLPRSIDYELWLRFSTHYEFYYLPEVTTYYRLWEGQMSQDKAKRLKYALMIMDNFINKNPGLIKKNIIRNAWCHAFTTRGRYKVYCSEYVEAIGYFLSALRYKPLYVYTWKSIFRMIVFKITSPTK
jgi:glycosyltransferase involved in cell wall biosynthesis